MRAWHVAPLLAISLGVTAAPLRPAVAQTESRKTTLNLTDVPLRNAIDLLFQGSGLQYSVSPNVPNVAVNLTVREVPLETALRLILRQAAEQVPGITSTKEEGVYVIRVRPAAPDAAPAEREETLIWEKIPLHFVSAATLAPMLGGTVMPEPSSSSGFGGQFASSGTGGDFRSTVVLAQLGGEPAQPAPAQAAPAQPAQPAPARPAPAQQGSRFGGFGGGGFGGGGLFGGRGGYPSSPLRVPEGIETVFGVPADNSLLVQGTPSAIQALERLIRLVDVSRRQVRLDLSVNGLAAGGQVFNGSPIRVTDTRGEDRMSMSLLPRINGDNTIEVTIEGELQSGAISGPISTRVRLEAGRRTQVFVLGEGPRQVSVSITAQLVPDR